ncbi:MAG: hypothetical protein HY096_00485 [Nitrospinae bacterium]|nr:hypothetical protein [Nitrospinota bacterium]
MTSKAFVDRLRLIIKELAEEKQTKFAKLINTYQANVGRWINPKIQSFPDERHLAAIQKHLGVNLNWLLTGEGEMFVKKEAPLAVHEALAGYGFNSKEREYIDKLIKILRTKQDKTVRAIKQNIDAFLDNPDKKNEVESDVSGVTDKDIKTANVK